MLKVMVVDDDPVILEVTRAVLENLGHTVSTRNEALGTSSAILAERPDVVLVDVQLPALTGDTLVRLARKGDLLDKGRQPAFILFSGEHADDLERLALETGAIGAIKKTGDPKQLAADFARIVSEL